MARCPVNQHVGNRNAVVLGQERQRGAENLSCCHTSDWPWHKGITGTDLWSCGPRWFDELRWYYDRQQYRNAPRALADLDRDAPRRSPPVSLRCSCLWSTTAPMTGMKALSCFLRRRGPARREEFTSAR
jgi:hypothetical protein